MSAWDDQMAKIGVRQCKECREIRDISKDFNGDNKTCVFCEDPSLDKPPSATFLPPTQTLSPNRRDCARCGKSFYSHPNSPSDTCRDCRAFGRFLNTCPKCKYTWKGRTMNPSKQCPVCHYRINKPQASIRKSAALVICQCCGEYKNADVIVCGGCHRNNTHSTHKFGITVKQFESFKRFITTYRGEDELALRLQTAFADPVQDPLPQIAPAESEGEVEPAEGELSAEEAVKLLDGLEWKAEGLEAK